MQIQINSLKEEVRESKARESELIREMKLLKLQCQGYKTDKNFNQKDVFLVGSSVLREVYRMVLYSQ